MKFFISFALLLLTLAISPFSWATGSSAHSVYTDLTDCQLLEEGQYWSVRKCPGQKEYQLFLHYADARDWLVIKTANEIVIDLRDDILNNAPGNFPEIPGPMEWRSKGNPLTALIFRVFGSSDYGLQKKSELFVVRIEGSKACLIGTTASNKQARQMADSNKRCP
jgi:hypothetical protein